MAANFKRKKIIGVIGQGKDCSPELLQTAEEIGFQIAQQEAILICGGLGGVMEAACRGAKRAQGLTIGVLPSMFKTDANRFIDIPIVTGMGEARNLIIVRSADALIAIGGRYGTLSEIAFALALGKPVIGCHTWENFEQIIYIDQPSQAVKAALTLSATSN
ncbi:MAG: TIGR00725 family protein [candidate division KSB1 bacterium]|nr:TIGR00725 family protein [candidate division KSB1 bacterium]